MNKRTHSTVSALLIAAGSMVANAADARTVTLELTNLTHGMYFTPRLAAVHGADYHFFQIGQPATEGLRTMAETGSPMVLAGELPADIPFAVDLNGNSPTIQEGVPTIQGPGSTTIITLENVADQSVFVSLGAMLMPTNDAIVGMDAFPIPDGSGSYELFLNAYDVGTELNTELVLPPALRSIPECSSNLDESTDSCNNTSYIPFHPDASQSGFFNVGLGGTGVIEAGSNELNVVHIHRNVIGDFNQSGGASDLDAAFHRWLNPVGRIRITVAP